MYLKLISSQEKECLQGFVGLSVPGQKGHKGLRHHVLSSAERRSKTSKSATDNNKPMKHQSRAYFDDISSPVKRGRQLFLQLLQQISRTAKAAACALHGCSCRGLKTAHCHRFCVGPSPKRSGLPHVPLLKENPAPLCYRRPEWDKSFRRERERTEGK